MSEMFWISVVTDLNTLVNNIFLQVRGMMGMRTKISDMVASQLRDWILPVLRVLGYVDLPHLVGSGKCNCFNTNNKNLMLNGNERWL
jgi:hypothetical protein